MIDNIDNADYALNPICRFSDTRLGQPEGGESAGSFPR